MFVVYLKHTMNILLVDDHPMTLDGFKNALLKLDFISSESTISANLNCKDAYDAIANASQNQTPFDLAIFDMDLPPYPEKAIFSGSDLVLLLQKEMPNCKTIIITAHTEILILYNIVKKTRPDAFLIKNEVDSDNFQQIIVEILQGKRYLSPIVKEGISEVLKKELLVEDKNRQILLYLHNGYKANELTTILNLSNGAIQKRIAKMKTAFEVTDDSNLIKEALKQGFV